MIPTRIMTVEQLGLPSTVLKFTHLKRARRRDRRNGQRKVDTLAA